ncbi:hypothetical protein JT359_11390 [Candidatus Poribacteria bacterium]|nr:hypothetical protein [Candidatus Poribacteria bacterium]
MENKKYILSVVSTFLSVVLLGYFLNGCGRPSNTVIYGTFLLLLINTTLLVVCLIILINILKK